MSKPLSTRELAVAAMIAALYTALCLALAPFSYGAVQVRAAEALTLLPVFSPIAIWGVTLGCALANLLGSNILGIVDVVFGSAATLVAAILSYRFRNIRMGRLPVLSAVPPVIVNAIVIGLELTYAEVGAFQAQAFAFNALTVGIGQLISCFALGLPLVYLLEKSGAADKIFKAK